MAGGSSPDAEQVGDLPIHIAAYMGKLAMVEFLSGRDPETIHIKNDVRWGERGG